MIPKPINSSIYWKNKIFGLIFIKRFNIFKKNLKNFFISKHLKNVIFQDVHFAQRSRTIFLRNSTESSAIGLGRSIRFFHRRF